ncbi:MAG: DUF1385 domain-containing protein [Anaerolineae bacterium]|nr:DUF1385 domain-containing protein [Anaerolineae bacterium]
MSATERMPSYGGQALIEGVLMRGANVVAAAMRAPDGKIFVQQERLSGIYQSSIRKIPFLRGLIILWDSLVLGTKFLTASANVQTGEDEKIEGLPLYATLAVSFSIAIIFFAIIPAVLAQVFEQHIFQNVLVGNLVEGIIRLIIVICYIWLIGKMPDIQRVFAYHGAEHKTINAYESRAELKPEVVKNFSLEHPRCGTSFILTLVFVSIIVFAFIGSQTIIMRLVTRVILLPVIVGFAYEYIRFAASHLDNPIIRTMIKPNLLLQRLTTREPSIDMLEVAIQAFNTMKTEEEQIQQGRIAV